MKYLTKKLRLLSSTLVALSFLMAITLSSCGGAAVDQSDDAEEATETEVVDETAGSDAEHPEGEHPEGGDDEHPTDSTAAEHPEG